MAFKDAYKGCIETKNTSRTFRDRIAVIPLCKAVKCDSFSPTAVYQALCSDVGFLLESIEGNEKIARYSMIGFNPLFSVTIGDEVVVTGDCDFAPMPDDDAEDAIEYINSVIDGIDLVDSGIPGFSSGLVGCFSYDNIYSIYSHAFRERRHNIRSPRAVFMAPRDCVIYDHSEKIAHVVSLLVVKNGKMQEGAREKAFRRISRMLEAIKMPAGGTSPSDIHVESAVSAPIGQEMFEDMTQRAKEYIFRGDIFQAVVSREYSCRYSGDPFGIYRALRLINPSPYMYYINFGDLRVIGASPEMLVRVKGNTVTTVPIAGTRPRGRTPSEDQQLEEELLQDRKECAEHTMLVDLARNDIGRVSRFGSVTIPSFMEVEKFSHVQHIVSVVCGELENGQSSFDAFRSCFPAGTVSGAPKIRAMQIIDELEDTPRGFYAGAVGHISFNGDMDFAIAIRTIIAEGGRLSYRVGAGIVADSIPSKEFEETEKKAEGMARAIIRSAEESS